MDPIKGLHHVTAIARDPQRNVDFYRSVLGQRLVKRTVNFDAPETYHFYFGDATGTPGSILTFFAWPRMRRGERGNRETNSVAYNIPGGSLGFWQEQLKRNGVTPEPVGRRFGQEVLPFTDPDGMQVELVESASTPPIRHWEAGPIPPAHALRGFHGVTLWLDEVELTARVLTELMRYRAAGQEGDRYRFAGDEDEPGCLVDIVHRPGKPGADFGAGSIHHIAFRVPGDSQQLEYQSSLRTAGLRVTDVMDRSYFHSIYYREPGGVLFEIATDVPGFATDEPVDALGESLKLPEWLEPERPSIEQGLPRISLSPVEKVG